MIELGELLKSLRNKKDMSLRDAAAATELSHSYIADLEKGYRRGTKTPIHPSPDTLKRLSSAYSYDYTKMMKIAGYVEDDENKATVEEKPTYDELYEPFMEHWNNLSEEERKEIYSLTKRLNELKKGNREK